ncbi:MAG: hypothetical protein AAGF81_20915 [Pseudomonadota bacterium]
MNAAELAALSDCVRNAQIKSYGKSGHWATARWKRFQTVSKHAYKSGADGGRFVTSHVNTVGYRAYSKHDHKNGKLPIGTTLVKPSFTVQPTGKVALGPLFIMEKMIRGFNADTADWRYAMVMPGGELCGLTGGSNTRGVEFSKECRVALADIDSLLFLPENVRK